MQLKCNLKNKQEKIHILFISLTEYASSCHASTTESLGMVPLRRVPDAIRVFQPYRSEVVGNQWLGGKESTQMGVLLPGRKAPHDLTTKARDKEPSRNILKVSRNYSNYIILSLKVTELRLVPGPEEHSHSLSFKLRSLEECTSEQTQDGVT